MKIQPNAPRSASHVLLAFGIFTALLAASLLWLGYRASLTETRFTKESITTFGTVVSKRVSQKTERNRDTNRDVIVTSHYVTYTFAPEEGRDFVQEESVLKATWDSLKEQDSVRVQYLPKSPDHNRLADFADTNARYVYLALGCVSAFLAVMLLRPFLRPT